MGVNGESVSNMLFNHLQTVLLKHLLLERISSEMMMYVSFSVIIFSMVMDFQYSQREYAYCETREKIRLLLDMKYRILKDME